MPNSLPPIIPPIHREGWRFVAIFAVATIIFFAFAEWLGWIGVVLTLWCAWFFRDPPRFTPVGDNLVISPADGVVQLIERAAPPPELGLGEDPRQRISVFMNVFNCHVNRSPVGGTVTKTAYRPGKFLNAALDKASTENERQSVVVHTADGRDIAFVQIAGLVARRILCEVEENQVLQAGERFGLIRFGSRVDIYLDDDMVPLVAVGQTMVAGETVIAEIRRGDEAPRKAEVR